MLESMWIGDEFYQVEFKPPFDVAEARVLERVGECLDLELSAGTRKVVVTIVREPLTGEIHDDKLQSRERERNRLERFTGDAPELPF